MAFLLPTSKDASFRQQNLFVPTDVLSRSDCRISGVRSGTNRHNHRFSFKSGRQAEAVFQVFVPERTCVAELFREDRAVACA